VHTSAPVCWNMRLPERTGKALSRESWIGMPEGERQLDESGGSQVVGGVHKGNQAHQLMAADAAMVFFAPMPSASSSDWVARFCIVELKKRCARGRGGAARRGAWG